MVVQSQLLDGGSNILTNIFQYQTRKRENNLKDLHKSPDVKMTTVLLIIHASIANYQHLLTLGLLITMSTGGGKFSIVFMSNSLPTSV